MNRAVFAALAAVACLAGASTAAAAPVATSPQSYQALDRVFPEPLAACKTGQPPCDPDAQGNLPATSFIGIEEFIDAIAFMNSQEQWQRYMEVYALDGSLEGHDETMSQHNNQPLEFDPNPKGQSAGLPTSDLGRRKSDLMVVRVTDESVPDAGKKRYALSLSIHGIERAGAEGGTRAMEDLVTAATTEGRLNEPIVNEAVKPGAPTYAEVLQNSIIYFTYPNPDGWRRGSVSSGPEGGVFFQRYNGNGVDPNRDWPDIGFAFRPYSAVSEPETAAWIQFYNDVKRKTGDRFAAGDDLHGQPFADALSYTLLPHGSHKFGKNQRIQAAAKRINRGTYEAIKWSPIVQENDQPQGGGAPCSPDVLGTACAKIYAQTWGSVYDTINYTTTGALGDWFDSKVGLNADGIDNEMSFSHLDKNINFDPHTEQLHVDGNRALIFARVAELIRPTHDEIFDARGRKGYVPGTRVQREERQNFPDAPPGTQPQTSIDETVPSPGSATKNFEVVRSDTVYNGGMRVEATANNVAGVGTGTATLQVQCKGCDRHPGVEDSDEFITVAEDFNQSPAYAQAGLVATVNTPQPSSHGVEWRAVVSGIGVAPTAATRFHIEFSSGPASADGDTGGGVPPIERAYNVSNTDFFEQLNDFMPGSSEDLNEIDPRAVIAGRQSLDRFDTIALADDPLPGYTGTFGRKPPTGPPTADQTFEGTVPVPSGGEGNPASFAEHEFTIGENDANNKATVLLEWDIPTNDWDMNVFYEQPDGTRTLVGRSAGSIPDNAEEVELLEPTPGKYVVQVENYSAADPRYSGSVTFERRATAGSDTGAYTEAEKDQWFAALRAWVRDGGNLVLTDGALRAINDVSPVPAAAVNRQTVYAGQSAFAKADEEDAVTTSDPLARGVVQPGARFNSGMRRQMFEPTPLGFAIQDDSGDDAAKARQYDIDRERWEAAGGRTVATSADAGARDAQAVYSRVTIGELPLGRGQIRIAGALLPKPTEDYDHQFGLEPYAVTYTGYIMARNLLDAPTRAAGVVSARGNRFKILTKRVRVRTNKKGQQIARIKVRCKSRRGCFGKLNLKVRKTKRPGRRDQAESAGRTRTKMVTIGRKKRFGIRKAAKAKKRVLRVKLTLEGRRLSSRKEKLRTRGSATVRFGKKGKGGRGVARRRIVLRRATNQRPLPPDIRQRPDAAGSDIGAAAGE